MRPHVKLLASAYWHARWPEWHHAHAQWPRHRACTPADINVGEQVLSVGRIEEMCREANAATTKEAT